MSKHLTPIEILSSKIGDFGLKITNNTDGSGSSIIELCNGTGGRGALFKTTNGYGSYRTIHQNDLGFFTDTGNISILNDNATGIISLTAGAGSSPQLSVTAAGNVVATGTITASNISNTNTGDQTDQTLPFSDNITSNATTGRHGFLPKLAGGTSSFLRADGAWASAGGGAGIPVQSSPPTSPATNDLWLDTSVSDIPNIITVSTSSPSGGNNGDIWIKYTA